MNNKNFSFYFMTGLSILVLFLIIISNFQLSSTQITDLNKEDQKIPQLNLFSKPEGKILSEDELEREFDSLEVVYDKDLDIE